MDRRNEVTIALTLADAARLADALRSHSNHRDAAQVIVYQEFLGELEEKLRLITRNAVGQHSA